MGPMKIKSPFDYGSYLGDKNDLLEDVMLTVRAEGG